MEDKSNIKEDKTSKVDSNLINKILGVMKNEFNKGQTPQPEKPEEEEEEIPSTSSKLPSKTIPVDNTEDSQDSPAKRALRSHYKSPDDKSDAPPEGTVAAEVKRSARRSKGPGESVLQSAIARKEKSFCTSPSNSNRKLRQPSTKKKVLKPGPSPKKPVVVSTGRKRGRPPNSERGETPVLLSAEINASVQILIKEEPKDTEDSESVASARTEEEVATPVSKVGTSQPPRVLESPSSRKRRQIAEEKDGAAGVAEELRKRPRRTVRAAGGIPSPSLADSSSDSGQPAKPESSAISHANPALKRVLCCCRARRGPRAAMCSVEPMPSSDGEEGPSTGELYCQAVESVDQTLVGCCNMAASTRLRRPASKIPYMLLCESHSHRLALHNCCPGCGIFCSQGRFVQCDLEGRVHHFHRGCQLVVGGGEGGGETLCPHCGAPTPDFDVRLEMKMPRKPVFLPLQKQLKQGPSAKMGFSEPRLQPGEDPEDLLPRASFVLPALCEGPHSEEDREKYSLKNLFNAAKSGDTELVLNIFGFGHNLNHIFGEFSQQTALHAAAQEGHLATVHLLVQAGAQLDAMDCEQLTPLMQAVLAGHGAVVKYLVKAGASLTLKGSDGMTALHLAAKSGSLEACTLLLTEHSSATPRTLLDAQDDGGWTALVWACEHSHFNIVKYLMSKRADPLIRDAEQNIALHWSTFSGSVDISELLLNYGSNVNATNAQGDTPLHIGARQENYECVLLLLARGARVDACNLVGDRPLDCCPHARTDCYTAINMNVQLQNLLSGTVERTQRILSNDISRGKEQNPIQVINGLDDDGVPTDFVYVSENCFTSDIHVDRKITSLQSCGCTDGCGSNSCYCAPTSARQRSCRCTDSCSTANCLCAHISLRCWYDEEGHLLPDFNFADPPLLFECNVGCGCNRVTCNNRVVQHGPTARFQLFRTDGKGWGVRTLRPIPKGTYVCEYIGEIISDNDADRREDDSYLFDLDNRDGETYCIDARRYGNVARFINHMCTPNLLPVKVFIDHQDLKFPRIAFFANRDISADEELGYETRRKCTNPSRTGTALSVRDAEKVCTETEIANSKIEIESTKVDSKTDNKDLVAEETEFTSVDLDDKTENSNVPESVESYPKPKDLGIESTSLDSAFKTKDSSIPKTDMTKCIETKTTSLDSNVGSKNKNIILVPQTNSDSSSNKSETQTKSASVDSETEKNKSLQTSSKVKARFRSLNQKKVIAQPIIKKSTSKALKVEPKVRSNTKTSNTMSPEVDIQVVKKSPKVSSSRETRNQMKASSSSIEIIPDVSITLVPPK